MTLQRDPDRENDALTEMLEVDFNARIKNVHTSMPGHIVDYDPATRRATVQPGLFLVLIGERPMRRPPILNVPVGHLAANGMVFHVPIKPGNAVHLVFSERGIGTWKRNMESEAIPDKGHYFDIADAIAYPVFGIPQGSPVTSDGFSLQTEDGNTYLIVEDGEIVINGLDVTIQGGTITIDGGAADITINGGNVTITGNTTINGSAAANAPAGTQSAAGPGPHTHDLTSL